MKTFLTTLIAIVCVAASFAQNKIEMKFGANPIYIFDSTRIDVNRADDNLFIGRYAGLNNVPIYHQDSTQGKNNTYMGSWAGRFNYYGYRNTYIGAQAGAYADGHENTSIGFSAGQEYEGHYGTFVGAYSGNNLEQGINTFVGYGAGFYADLCERNTKIGYMAGSQNNTGTNNVFVGHHAGSGTNHGAGADPDHNVFIGSYAGGDVLHGDRNTSIGTESLYSVQNGIGNVAVGYMAGYNETGSNKLYIENSNSNTPLLYGEFDNDILRVNGELQVKDQYKFPLTKGTNDQVLRTDGAGQLVWSNDFVDDADNDPLNELIDSVSFMFPFLIVHQGGIDHMVDLGILYADSDADSGNELQTLSVVGDSLKISNGNGVKMPAGSAMEDGDSDTRIELYEGASDGVLFTVDNKIIMGVDSSGIQFFNNSDNTFIGEMSGGAISTGSANTFLGDEAGKINTTGSGNTFAGRSAGASHGTGNNNTYLGARTGLFKASGSGNVFIGNDAGSYATGDNKLYIDNSDTNSPLIYGEFDNDLVQMNADLDLNGSFIGDLDIQGNLSVSDTTSHFFLKLDTIKQNIHLRTPTFTVDSMYDSSPLTVSNVDTSGIFDSTMFYLQIDATSINQVTRIVNWGFEEPGYNELELQSNGGYVNLSDGTLQTDGEGHVSINTSPDSYPLYVTTSDTVDAVSRFRYNSLVYSDIIAVEGISTPVDFYGYGGKFEGGYTGAEGIVEPTGSGSYFGIRGRSNGGDGTNYGVWGYATGDGTNYAVYAQGDLAYTGSLINASDARLKKNIAPISSALSTIMLLNPSRYEYRRAEYPAMNLAAGAHFGFLAQELEEVLPELVKDQALQTDPRSKESSGESMKAVNYTELIPVLTAAIQEQQQIIEQLVQRIQQLEQN